MCVRTVCQRLNIFKKLVPIKHSKINSALSKIDRIVSLPTSKWEIDIDSPDCNFLIQMCFNIFNMTQNANIQLKLKFLHRTHFYSYRGDHCYYGCYCSWGVFSPVIVLFVFPNLSVFFNLPLLLLLTLLPPAIH